MFPTRIFRSSTQDCHRRLRFRHAVQALIAVALPLGLFMSATTTAAADPLKAELNQLPKTSALPAGVVKVSPYVPGMGEHWANPANLPFGPIYCVVRGHITCMEYMVSQKDFIGGVSHNTLVPWFSGSKQPAINHIDIGFEPHGHAGYEIPHYDIHMYFLSPAARQAADKLAMK